MVASRKAAMFLLTMYPLPCLNSRGAVSARPSILARGYAKAPTTVGGGGRIYDGCAAETSLYLTEKPQEGTTVE
jgi:hypothetical protein